MLTNPRLPIVLLLGLATYFLYFHQLDGMGLISADEPRYAWIGREMARSGDFITPRLWGEPWFEKPPLLYWITAMGFRAGLSNDLAPRLPLAILSVLFLAIYWRLLRESCGESAARFAVIALGTSAGWLAYSHVAVMDVPLTATFGAGMLLCLHWLESGNRKRLPYAGAALGLAMLAKGLAPVVLSLPLIWMSRKRWRDWWRIALPALMVAGPWFLLCYLRNGRVFWDVFIVQHHFGRFTNDALQHVQPFWFYIPVFLGLLFPWSLALALAGRPQSITERFLWGWLLFVIVFFSQSVNKLPGYVLPALPAACALTGIAIARSPRGTRAVITASAALVALIVPAAAVLPDAVSTGLTSIAPSIGLPLLLLPVFGLIAIAIDRRKGSAGAGAAVAILLTAGIAYLKQTAFPELDRKVSARVSLKGVSPGEVCLDNPRRAFQYGVYYYAGKVVPDCETEPRRVRLQGR